MKTINVIGRPSVLFITLSATLFALDLASSATVTPLLLAICYEIGRYRGNKVGLEKGNAQGLEKARVDYNKVREEARAQGFRDGEEIGKSSPNGLAVNYPPDHRSAHVLATSYNFAGQQYLVFRNISTGKVMLHRFDPSACSWFGEGVQPKVHKTYVWMPNITKPEEASRHLYKLVDIGDQGAVERHDPKSDVATT